MTPLLTHLALHVADLDKSIHFYRDFVGMRLMHQRDDVETNQRTAWLTTYGPDQAVDFAIVLLCGDPTLFGGAGPQAPVGPVSHLGFAMKSRAEVDAMAEKAEAFGVLVKPPMYINKVVNYICFAADPDGHSVEFSHGQDFDRDAN
jgi:catechol 2,3-dioxygenase-like lactoylglutathione lyase family enzyme